MAVCVLVMTPIRSFGELIQQALQEAGNYKVDLVHSGQQALERAKNGDISVAVLDFDLDPQPAKLVAALHEAISDLRIIAIKFEADQANSSLINLPLAACLDSPFYLPDLLDAMKEITSDLRPLGKSPAQVDESPFPSAIYDQKKSAPVRHAPEWLQDVNRAAQHLTRLSLETSAQAAVITRNEELWAYAGQLSKLAAEELARTVGYYWARDGGSDLARFVRLEANGGEYMLYATGLGGEYVLALAFEIEIPFSEIRSQAANLAQGLTNPPEEDSAPPNNIEQKSLPPKNDFDDMSEQEYLDEVGLPKFPSDWRPDQDVADGRQAFFKDLLSSMDVPDPNGNANAKLIMSEQVQTVVEESAPENIESIADHLVETKSHRPKDETIAIAIADETPDYLLDTQPVLVQEQNTTNISSSIEAAQLEPEDNTLHNLTYSCVMVPRLPQHHMVGDLAIHINQWIQQLSLAFDWRLEHISIRPNYVYWMAVTPPGTSPGHMVRNLQEHVSQRIFAEYPRLARENPSGDFWAPGYMIINGKDPIPYDLIQDFIGKTRHRQGTSRSR